MNVSRTTISDFEEIPGTESNADVHCIIQDLSPVKKGKSGTKYFDGQVSDGKKSIRVVGFDEQLQSKLSTFRQRNTPIKIEKCQVKRGKDEEYEILMNKATTISPSPKKIEIPVHENATHHIQIEEVSNATDGTCINIVAHVADVLPPRPVSTGVIQEITLVDETGHITLTMWDTLTNKLQMSKTYIFKKLFVRSFRNTKSLTFTKQSSFDEKNEDHEQSLQINTDDNNADTYENFNDVSIIGTKDFTLHYACVNCSLRLQNVNTSDMCRCTSCNVMQCIQSCRVEISIGLLFSNKRILKADTEIIIDFLKTITNSDTPDFRKTETIILTAVNKKMNVTYSRKNGYITKIDTLI